jgi:hypothetical protein
MRRQLPCLSMVLANCDDCAWCVFRAQSPQRRRTERRRHVLKLRVACSSVPPLPPHVRFLRLRPHRRIVSSRAQDVAAATEWRLGRVARTCGREAVLARKYPSAPRERSERSELTVTEAGLLHGMHMCQRPQDVAHTCARVGCALQRSPNRTTTCRLAQCAAAWAFLPHEDLYQPPTPRGQHLTHPLRLPLLTTMAEASRSR